MLNTTFMSITHSLLPIFYSSLFVIICCLSLCLSHCCCRHYLLCIVDCFFFCSLSCCHRHCHCCGHYHNQSPSPIAVLSVFVIISLCSVFFAAAAAAIVVATPPAAHHCFVDCCIFPSTLPSSLCWLLHFVGRYWSPPLSLSVVLSVAFFDHRCCHCYFVDCCIFMVTVVIIA